VVGGRTRDPGNMRDRAFAALALLVPHPMRYNAHIHGRHAPGPGPGDGRSRPAHIVGSTFASDVAHARERRYRTPGPGAAIIAAMPAMKSEGSSVCYIWNCPSETMADSSPESGSSCSSPTERRLLRIAHRFQGAL
jgi:hypothetical protein